jgi:Ca2+-binding RTX toxin-like protein
VLLGDEQDTFQMADDAYPPAGDAGNPQLKVEGGEARDILTGGSGPDYFRGDEDRDDLLGHGGVDELYGGAGPDLLGGGAGDDYALDGGSDDDRIDAGPGDDTVVYGDSGNDTIDGGAGDDDPRGGEGIDTVRGGEGDDRLDIYPEDALGTDTLEGGSGDDLLWGGDDQTEADILTGGDGSDTADYSRREAPLTIDTDGVADDGQAGENDNVAPDVERILGGLEGDTLTGDDGSETLDGGPGGDQLNGLGGDDTLEGGVNSGDSDSLAGGDGNDTLRGGAGDDSLSGGNGLDDLRGGGGADTLTGEAGPDALAGGPGIDALDGGAGDDSLLGGPGNDRLDGGFGADRMSGEAGRDTVSYEDRNAPIRVTFDDLPNDGEENEGDNVAADVEIVISGAVADTLSGDGRENELNASSGDDFADPGAGLDRLFGGTGADVLRARDGGRDVVDCGPGEDLAIVDRQDTARDCETVDRGNRRRPKYRALALARPQGTVRLRIPEANRFVPFSDRSAIPLGSAIDTRAGAVNLITRARNGALLEGRFEGGRFTVDQTAGTETLTVLRLPRLTARACRARASAGRRAAPPPEKLWGNVAKRRKKRGTVQTRTDQVRATARGTSWLTEVRCEGTLVEVREGVVEVRDLIRKRTIQVRAGQRYLARAR